MFERIRRRIKAEPEATATPRRSLAATTEVTEGDRAVILNRDSGMYHGLNATAYFLWQGIRDGVPEQELLASYAAQFAVDEQLARRDLAKVLAQLSERGLISR